MRHANHGFLATAGHRVGMAQTSKPAKRRLRFFQLVCNVLTLLLIGLHVHASSFDDDALTLAGNNTSEHAAARHHLYSGGSEAMSALVKHLDKQPKDSKVRLVLTLQGIHDSDKTARMKDADLAEFTRVLRNDPDPAMRGLIMQTLRDVGGNGALNHLERTAIEDSNAGIRRNAILAVGGISHKETAFFKKQTKDSSRLVQLAAYEMLAESGDASGRALALQTLNNPATEGEKLDAIWILGESGNPADLSVLNGLNSASSTHQTVKFLAQEAIKTIQLLQQPASARPGFLIQALDDPSPTVRHWASNKLRTHPSPETALLLKKYFAEPGHRGTAEALDAISQP